MEVEGRVTRELVFSVPRSPLLPLEAQQQLREGGLGRQMWKLRPTEGKVLPTLTELVSVRAR